ncbi:MAG: RagB/SusD family nutrient uptake outer membrane protein, partial [Sphingobacteriales bacterium]
YYYFQGVRLFGSIPLKTTPTTSLENLDLDKAPVEDIYNQVVADLIKAADSGLPAEDVSGHVSSNAVHALLAKVYLTMAGYPLQKGAEYYQKALDEANLVINAGVTLYPKYADLRNAANDNKGEQIFMIQREGQFASSILHFQFLPFPEVPISRNTGSGGGMAPNPAFYDSYEPNDLRIQNKQYYYTKAANITTGDTITLPRPYIYKYWDDDAEVTGRNGMNIPLIRFADVLLMAAEAKVMVDGGTSTSDQAAVDAWWQVHHRAFPALTDADKPASITFNDVMKERFWELSFEFQLWYDMLRTRKAFDVATGQMTNLIGYKAPRHTRAFVETDLLLPIPLVEIQKNPKLDK